MFFFMSYLVCNTSLISTMFSLSILDSENYERQVGTKKCQKLKRNSTVFVRFFFRDSGYNWIVRTKALFNSTG